MTRISRLGYVVVLVTLCTNPLCQGETVKLFLLGGQSNMAGAGRKAEAPKETLQPHPRVKMWNGKQFVPFPTGPSKRGSFGPEIGFARAMAAALPNETIYLVKHAVGGTSLHGDWDPKKGRLYAGFARKASAAVKALKAKGKTVNAAGMLWMQGEQDSKDSDNPGPAKAYEKNLRNLIATVRKAYNLKMPFIIGRIHITLLKAKPHRGKDFGQAGVVRAAMGKVAETDKLVGMIDTDKLGLHKDNVHFNTAGQLKMGKDFARELLRIMKASKEKQ